MINNVLRVIMTCFPFARLLNVTYDSVYDISINFNDTDSEFSLKCELPVEQIFHYSNHVIIQVIGKCPL